jgi:hypothetical protein
MQKIKLPKEGVLYKKDKTKKIEFVKTYSRVRFNIYSLISWVGIKRDYKKEPKDNLMLTDNFLHYIEKEQYEI